MTELQRAVLEAMVWRIETCWSVAQALYRRRDWEAGQRRVGAAMLGLERLGYVRRVAPERWEESRLWEVTPAGDAALECATSVRPVAPTTREYRAILDVVATTGEVTR